MYNKKYICSKSNFSGFCFFWVKTCWCGNDRWMTTNHCCLSLKHTHTHTHTHKVSAADVWVWVVFARIWQVFPFCFLSPMLPTFWWHGQHARTRSNDNFSFIHLFPPKTHLFQPYSCQDIHNISWKHQLSARIVIYYLLPCFNTWYFIRRYRIYICSVVYKM